MSFLVKMEKAKATRAAHLLLHPSLPPIMENFTHLCASLCSSSSRLNLALASTFLASIFFLSLRFSPSFLTLLLLIPSTLFLTKKKSHSIRSSDAAIAVLRHSEELSSDGEGSRNGFDSDLWMCLDELARNLPFSDDSSSEDDDSLIEIALLPKSNAIRTDSNNGGGNLDLCLPDLLPDSVLRERGFVELLEEIGEEENLIEIDISRGFNRDFPVFAVEASDSGAKYSETFDRQCPIEQSVI